MLARLKVLLTLAIKALRVSLPQEPGWRKGLRHLPSPRWERSLPSTLPGLLGSDKGEETAAEKTTELKMMAEVPGAPGQEAKKKAPGREQWMQRISMNGKVWSNHRAETLSDVSSTTRVAWTWVELPLIHVLHPPEAQRNWLASGFDAEPGFGGGRVLARIPTACLWVQSHGDGTWMGPLGPAGLSPY